ncbi:MAG TPA: MFS transporter [Hyphomicrobiales bacterium]|nr:MFS transporter [Hyphomicrobiales bacterium]
MASFATAGFARRLSFFYGALFLSIGVYLPFFPVWLSSRGLSESEIGAVLAAPLVVRILFTPISGAIADRQASRKGMLVLYCWLALLGFSILGAVSGFVATLLAVAFTAVFWSSVMPLTEALALVGVRRYKADYGRMRLWGSATFIIANFAAGAALDLWPTGIVYWLILGTVAFAAMSAHGLPRVPSADPVGTTGVAEIAAPGARAVLANPAFLAMLGASALTQASHAMMYTFGSIYWQARGFSGLSIGVLWALGVIAEITLFAVSGRVLARISPVGLMAVGAGAAVLRWSLMPLEPPLAVTAILQLLHGLTFGAAHLGIVHFIARSVPERYSGSAQSLNFTAMGACMALATYASGQLYKAAGAAAFGAMAATALVALLLAVAVVRPAHHRGGRVG